MNLILAYIEPSRGNSEGLIFSERICCAGHMAKKSVLEKSHLFPIGKTNEFCHYCAEEENRLMEQIRSESWFSQLTPESVVYLSGPMSGLPNYNCEKFWKLEHAVKRAGCRVLSPAHHDKEKTYAEYMKASTDMVFACTHVVMMMGYEDSKGAMAELHLASALGKTIYFTKSV